MITADDEPVLGRRERKKAATRQAIADAALELFLAHGYDAVSVRDIAEKADVSTTTLFKHFSGKEALVFDRESDLAAELAASVRGRLPGHSVVDALRTHALTHWVPLESDPRLTPFMDLVAATPALHAYEERMWSRHAVALAAVIAEELGRDADDLKCAALARFVVDVPSLAAARPATRAAVEEIFDLLQHGWQSEESST